MLNSGLTFPSHSPATFDPDLIELGEYLKWGIHVMVAQNQEGELTIGDSHEYGLTQDPFDKYFINRMILDYLKKFARFKEETIAETWNGIYPKLTSEETELVLQPEAGVTNHQRAWGCRNDIEFWPLRTGDW